MKWITPTYDDDSEISNPEFANAPDDSYWWMDDGYLHTVVRKDVINNQYRFPRRIALVPEPEATKRQEDNNAN